jgi:hypothetical protein
MGIKLCVVGPGVPGMWNVHFQARYSNTHSSLEWFSLFIIIIIIIIIIITFRRNFWHAYTRLYDVKPSETRFCGKI